MKPNAPETAGRPPLQDDPTEHLGKVSARLAEIKDYVAYYVSAKLDSYKSSAKSAALWAVVGLLGAVAGTAVLATAGVLVVVGIAEGLTQLFGGRAWLGDLVTGVALLAIVLGTTFLMVRRMLGQSRLATAKKYEALRRQQMAKHGHDVHERAATAEQE